MLHLTTAAGERLEIPAACLIAVMKPCDGQNPCAIIYDIGAGPQVDQLSDQYGFVKKLAADGMAMVNPIEVRILEHVPESSELGEGKLFLSRSRIVGRREVRDDTEVNAIVFVDLFGKTAPVKVADTFDEMDGIEPASHPIVTAPTEGN